MNLDIKQSNIYLLLPSKVSWITGMIMEDKGVSIVDAMKEIYTSNMYRQLEDESTKLWHLGPVALYETLIESN